MIHAYSRLIGGAFVEGNAARRHSLFRTVLNRGVLVMEGVDKSLKRKWLSYTHPTLFIHGHYERDSPPILHVLGYWQRGRSPLFYRVSPNAQRSTATAAILVTNAIHQQRDSHNRPGLPMSKRRYIYGGPFALRMSFQSVSRSYSVRGSAALKLGHTSRTSPILPVRREGRVLRSWARARTQLASI